MDITTQENLGGDAMGGTTEILSTVVVLDGECDACDL